MNFRIGIIGCGAMTMGAYVPALQSMPESYTVVAVADPSDERRDLVGDALGVPGSARFASGHELVTAPDLDAVLVLTPPQVRAEFAVAAAAAGKNVLCEKPLATRPADAARAIRTAAENGVRLAVSHNYLWFPEYAAAREVIASGEIGDVQVVEINALGVWDNPGAASTAYNWRHDPAAGGGGVLDGHDAPRLYRGGPVRPRRSRRSPATSTPTVRATRWRPWRCAGSRRKRTPRW